MAHGSPPRRQQRIEWMWNANVDPWSSSQPAEWRFYSDVETAIIEEAFQNKLNEALLDDYHIDFTHLVQISNNNFDNQRPVKRIVDEREEARLREKRFMSNPLAPSSPFAEGYERKFLYRAGTHFGLTYVYLTEHMVTKSVIRRMVIERAAEGIIIEGKKLGKQREAEWIAQQLLNVKEETKEEMWQCCARLYCMESFLYKKLNETMRLVGDDAYADVWESKACTFGPFALLFFEYMNLCM